MIDAAKFSSSYTAFWNMATPTCEHLVRKINMSLYERHAEPLVSTDNENRPLIAEFGFILFAARKEVNDPLVSQAMIDAALSEAKARVSRLSGELTNAQQITQRQLAEGIKISDRLISFFSGPPTILRPIFPGCGFVDRSEGDVIFGRSLYEVKTVDRPFRGSDLRQLVTYAALNYMGKTNSITRIGAYNPRRGIYFDLALDFVSRQIAGKSEKELFEDIVQAIAGNGISR